MKDSALKLILLISMWMQIFILIYPCIKTLILFLDVVKIHNFQVIHSERQTNKKFWERFFIFLEKLEGK